ncbi:MAG TPA: CdaR family protein [Candidatus Limnocylindrales bacterium]
MRRLSDFLLRNWPLKLGAVLFASVLYSGLVVSQNVRVWNGALPVFAVRQPAGTTLLADLEPVTSVRFRAPLDVFVSPNTFTATADLSRVQALPGGPAVDVPITVTALDSRVVIVGFEPDVVQVHLDPVDTRQMIVTVATGPVPEGLRLGVPQIEPAMVAVRGASSRVAAIRSISARVPIDASALNVDRDVELIAVDEQGNTIGNVEIDPPRARVRIAVARELATRTLPVVPQLTGTLGSGLRLAAVEVRPLSVTVSGEESLITTLESAPTDPIDLTGRTRDFELDIPLALPAGVTVTGAGQVHVVVSLAEEEGSRTFQVGVVLEGERGDLSYQAPPAVAVTLGGPLSRLNTLDAAALTATVDVTGLDVGEHSLAVGFAPPSGLELVSISPSEAIVTITAAGAAASSLPASAVTPAFF